MKHTRGRIEVRMIGTCSGAWAEIVEVCVDPVTKEEWFRELGQTECTHVVRHGPTGGRLGGPVGDILERPHRFEPTEDSEELLANAKLWALSHRLVDILLRAHDAIEALDGTSIENEKLVDDYRALMAEVSA